MANITVKNPWYFNFLKEIVSSGKYKLSILAYLGEAGYIPYKKKDDLSSGSTKGRSLIEVDTTKLNHSTKFFWLGNSRVVKNPKPRPRRWWNRLDYWSEYTEISVSANIEVIGENALEVWVYGEKHLEEIKTFLEGFKSLEEIDVKIELRQTNSVGY
ncbi:MAG: hypothetical protein AAB477_01810 [Patescibacteria group bacterium]